MATVGLYGNSSSGVVAAASGSESTGLYGNTTTFGGTYFEWFIFQVADTQPATPTGGSWDFSTSSGTPPTGWTSTPPANPSNTVWVSIAIVNSKNASSLTWSAPGKFSYSSGLPILSGAGTPDSGLGQSDQLYVQTDSTPQTIWFKESGTWTRLTGSTLYVDLTSNQTVAGTKTFSSQIQGSISGTASNVTGIVGIANGGTGATTTTGARTALSAAASGANSDITSLSGLTTALSIAQGGTGATTANGALTNLGGIGTITSTDGSITVTPAGTSVNIAVSEASPASTLLTPVRNTTGATLTKGTVVYISGATGQIATVSKALATSDATSAQTLGMITTDLPNNTNGYVTVFGLIVDIDTSAYTDGAQLYLSGTTAGAVTATKPSAPTHLVYVAVVEYAHAVHGKLLVKVQNGYELEELHNVAISSPVTGQTITYNSSTSLWSNSTVSLTAGVNGTLPIANGGTGQTTANDAFNALAPSQTGNSGKYLTTDGTNTSWATNPLGTVTSVSGTGTVSGITLSGTVTTSGSLTLGGSLDLSAYNGAGAFTTLSASSTVTLSGGTANGVAYLNGSKVLTSGSALTFDGTNLTLGAGSAVENYIAVNAATYAWQRFKIGGTDRGYIGTPNSFLSGGAGTDFGVLAVNNLVFGIGSSEQMRLTSTGLGIGTSSPYLGLSVYKTSDATFTNLPANALFYDATAMAAGVGGGIWLGGRYLTGSTSITTFAAISGIKENGTGGDVAGTMTFGVRDSGGGITIERMRLNSSGNLGIGTSSPAYKLDVNGQARLNNLLWFTPSSGLMAIGASGTNFQIYNGAGAETRLTVDNQGNLGLGVTPSAWESSYKVLDIASGGAAVFGGTSFAGIANNSFVNSSFQEIYKTSNPALQYLQVVGQHRWYTAPSGTAGNAISFTQAMTLDASGNLIIGATSAAQALHVARGSGVSSFSTFRANGSTSGALYGQDSSNNAYCWNESNAVLLFGTNNTERARIDSSGNWILGNTSNASYGTVRAYIESAGSTAAIKTTGGASSVPLGVWNTAASGTINLVTFFYGSGLTAGSITTNGTLTSYNTTSDYRLKNVIGSVSDAGERIDALEPIEYEWKSNGERTRGFLAHKFQEVYPQSVSGEKDAVDADGKPVYQAMQASTSEVIADLVAEIQSLRKRLAAAGIA